MRAGVIDHLEALGLRTIVGKEFESSNATHEAVAKLYKCEIPSLFGRPLRHESIYRENANLLDKELDEMLKEFGPHIWPRPGSGDRSHLKAPKKGTRYTSELVYPRDRAVLKRHLRSLVLSKGERRVRRTDKSAPATPVNNRRVGRPRKRVPTPPPPLASSEGGSDDGSDSDDSVVGTQTRHKTSMKTLKSSSTASHDQLFRIELRLYRASSLVYDHVEPLEPIVLNSHCTSDECFSLVCEQIESDASWMTFQFPEDMSRQARIRVDRGLRGSDVVFQRVLDIFRAARQFPGGLLRAVEVEVGLDVLSDL